MTSDHMDDRLPFGPVVEGHMRQASSFSRWGPRLLVVGVLLVNLAMAVTLGGRWRWLLVAITALKLALGLVLQHLRPHHPAPDDE